MTTLPDILRGFRPAGEELLRITQCVTEPFAAVDPRHLDVQVAAGGAARLVVLHTSPELSALRCTLGEGARLERVFENLLDNATSFSPDGGLITVSAARERSELAVRVEDNHLQPVTLSLLD